MRHHPGVGRRLLGSGLFFSLLMLFGTCSSVEMPPVSERIDEAPAIEGLDTARIESLKNSSDRFVAPEGFVVEQVADDELVGSVVNLTFTPDGKPFLALEGQGLVVLDDRDGDGKYEHRTYFSKEIKAAHGLEFVGPGDLLANAWGPEGTGLYRLHDTNGDDVCDHWEMLVPSVGPLGEHGPHEIEMGPDGSLYVLYGNHSYPDAPIDRSSPSRNLWEDNLLPRYLDPRGHARNVTAPGGTIHRFDLAGGSWSQIAGGFRNPFDFAIDRQGELFTFDSDMEWDFGLPWYKPVRVLHVIPGGDYGWRTGSGKFPSYYVDTLPSIDEVGRGSPVGLKFYDHHVYPEAYRGALFMGDWSRGRIRVIFPHRRGATFAGKTVDFVYGRPLNVTDLDVGPDGFLYFSTGGRLTEGGLYRVRYLHGSQDEPRSGIEGALQQPMPRSAWGQVALRALKESLGENWASGLREVVLDASRPVDQRMRALELLQIHGPRPDLALLKVLAGSEDPSLRGEAIFLLGPRFPLSETMPILLDSLADDDPAVVRRSAEALVAGGLDSESGIDRSHPLVGRLVSCLGSEDRFVRSSCRIALGRIAKKSLLSLVEETDPNKNPALTLQLLLVLTHRLERAEEAQQLFEKLDQLPLSSLRGENLLDFLRILELALIRDPRAEPGARVAGRLGSRLLQAFPDGDERIDRELLEVLSFLEVPGIIEKGMEYLRTDLPNDQQIHVVYCLRTVETGWTPQSREELVQWFRKAWQFRGAASMEGFLDDLWASSLELLEPDERERAEALRDQVQSEKMQQLAAYLAEDEQDEAERWSRPGDRLGNMSFEELSDYIEYDPMSYEKADLKRGRKVFYLSKCVSCHVFGDEGRGGGPDLSTVVNRFRRRDILEAIMFPSRVVSDQYVSWEVRLKDSTEITGMFVAESETELTLITATGERVDVPKDQIQSRRQTKVSIMPEGLIDTMTVVDLVSLMAYLEKGADAQ